MVSIRCTSARSASVSLATSRWRRTSVLLAVAGAASPSRPPSALSPAAV
ncbi:hypothetical protein ACFSTC_35450 [Nonomuraea ferruginea]